MNVKIDVVYAPVTGFPVGIELKPDGGCPVKLAKQFAAQHNVKLLAVQTTGTDNRLRTYKGEMLNP